jgi:Ser/Thr protein kinase RdoA (MazF antagonist)
MKAFLRALEEAAVRWALVMAALSVWLLLSAYLDGQPYETDALQASADISESLAAMHAAAKGP